jgi:hypothetical protein
MSQILEQFQNMKINFFCHPLCFSYVMNKKISFSATRVRREETEVPETH